MNFLCLIGLHKWHQEVVLRQTFEETGSVINYDNDVCARCEKLRDPEAVADAYNVMASMRGTIEMHPPSTRAKDHGKA